MSQFTTPVTLIGVHAQLEPLLLEHGEALEQAAVDGELWKLWYTSVPAPGEMAAEIERRLALHAKGSMLPFTVRERATGRIVGMTSFMHIETADRRVEIGSTWYAASVQRTALNTECKLLLLTHAFETLDCIVVELRTHWMNHRSRAAIARLGAKQDGVLRNHRILPDGSYRDTVVFSIIESEWLAVKANLRWRLNGL